jgi:hypothetical protein
MKCARLSGCAVIASAASATKSRTSFSRILPRNDVQIGMRNKQRNLVKKSG